MTSHWPASSNQRGVNVLCVDVRELFRGNAHESMQPAASPSGRDFTKSHVAQWVKGNARDNVALPPVSPADPVVLEEVLRDPIPTLTGARPPGVASHGSRTVLRRRPRRAAAPTVHLHHTLPDPRPASVERSVASSRSASSTSDTPPPQTAPLLSQPLSALAAEVVDNVLSRLHERHAPHDDADLVQPAVPQSPSRRVSDVRATPRPVLVTSEDAVTSRGARTGVGAATHWKYRTNAPRDRKPRAFERVLADLNHVPAQHYAWQCEQLRRRQLSRPAPPPDSRAGSGAFAVPTKTPRTLDDLPMTGTLHGFAMQDGMTRIVPGPFRHRVIAAAAAPVTRRPKKR